MVQITITMTADGLVDEVAGCDFELEVDPDLDHETYFEDVEVNNS
jgi:hypothetical protein